MPNVFELDVLDEDELEPVEADDEPSFTAYTLFSFLRHTQPDGHLPQMSFPDTEI